MTEQRTERSLLALLALLAGLVVLGLQLLGNSVDNWGVWGFIGVAIAGLLHVINRSQITRSLGNITQARRANPSEPVARTTIRVATYVAISTAIGFGLVAAGLAGGGIVPAMLLGGALAAALDARLIANWEREHGRKVLREGRLNPSWRRYPPLVGDPGLRDGEGG
jgi:hypothetical protein